MASSAGENAVNGYFYVQFAIPLGKIIWQYLLKLKIHIPFDQAIPLLGIYPIGKKKKKGPVHKDIGTKRFIAALPVEEQRKRGDLK